MSTTTVASGKSVRLVGLIAIIAVCGGMLVLANRIEPRKRPLSSMTPTFVEDGKGVLILGAPGGRDVEHELRRHILTLWQTALIRAWSVIPCGMRTSPRAGRKR